MPELPEVESVRRQLAPELTGRVVLSVVHEPQRRFLALDRLPGARIVAVTRRGKFLVCPLDGGRELVLHLGMTGSLHFGEPDGYARARLLLDDDRQLVFRDPRRFGRVATVDAGDYSAIPTLATLGPEPFSEAFDPATFARALARTRAPVKAFLLSQRPVAGVGNIYADEALWRARIHPASRRVGASRAHRLPGTIRAVLAEAIAREGTTFSDYRLVNGDSGRNLPHLDVYGRAGRACPRCGRPLRRLLVGGRGTTYCAGCQRP
jgi:formamidopyrimidine-DNA glycosylase